MLTLAYQPQSLKSLWDSLLTAFPSFSVLSRAVCQVGQLGLSSWRGRSRDCWLTNRPSKLLHRRFCIRLRAPCGAACRHLGLDSVAVVRRTLGDSPESSSELKVLSLFRSCQPESVKSRSCHPRVQTTVAPLLLPQKLGGPQCELRAQGSLMAVLVSECWAPGVCCQVSACGSHGAGSGGSPGTLAAARASW